MSRIAYTATRASARTVGVWLGVRARLGIRAWVVCCAIIAGTLLVPPMVVGQRVPEAQERVSRHRGEIMPRPLIEITEIDSQLWDFGRASDTDFDNWPDQWKRYRGIGFPGYVGVAITARDAEIEKQFQALDTVVIRGWGKLKKSYPTLPLPPSLSDIMVDRYLRVDLDGGQFKIQSPTVVASRLYQYRFSCKIMTRGLRHDRARAELIFLSDDQTEIASHSTKSVRGNSDWTELQLQLVRPPIGATQMMVRLMVQRSETGLEDIRGSIGFDDIRIDQYPQLQLTTDESLGVYSLGQTPVATAKIMGLPSGVSDVLFRLLDSEGNEISTTQRSVNHHNAASTAASSPIAPANAAPVSDKQSIDSIDSVVRWTLPFVRPGFYRVTAALDGNRSSTLATETTFVVIDQLVDGPPHGCFGWTLPRGVAGVPPKEMAKWLSRLGVSWVKYPCWLNPDDISGVEQAAILFNKFQDSGLQTVGMLDQPPESHVSKFNLRSRREMVASQLFRDRAIWQPMLEPVMTRLTLKVRTWQLGAEHDFSFLGRPRLRDSISQVATGLQGFGQPIEVAVSWPWLEPKLPPQDTSWQAVCRSGVPALNAQELDSFLGLEKQDSRNSRARTWLLLDPTDAESYDRDSRILDMVTRMAVVRSHRVQAAFVSDPHHAKNGLLREDGRPNELLLPWRTTSRLIGDMRKVGSLQLRCGAQNSVFVGKDRAVVLLWSSEPKEERIYLGENVQAIDVWGNATTLPVESDPIQPAQRVEIGRLPTFIVGADPMLLAFRMSVQMERTKLDSLLSQVQQLPITFTNPTRDSIVGDMRVRAPESWTVDAPLRKWETLPGRSSTHVFDVVLDNTAKIGNHEFPIQFRMDTVPPKMITVYRKLDVGPEGLDIVVTTRLLESGELRVQVELTNSSLTAQSYDCMLFPQPGRQYQRRLVAVAPGETERREFFWPNASDMLGKRMLLRAVEEDGNRVVNYPIDVVR